MTILARIGWVLEQKRAYLDAVLISSIFIAMLASTLLGERIPTNGGFGWDGVEYGNIAEHFEQLIVERSLNSYRIQRVLPSAVVHYSLKLLSIPFTPPAIILAFGLMNVALLTVGAAVWCRLANHLEISPQAKVIGFMGLFANYAVLKMTAYYPVLTDTSGLTLGILALHLYVIGSGIGLCVLTVVGSFTWPTIAYECALFLLFPCTPSPQPALTVHASLRKMVGVLRRNDRRILLVLLVLLPTLLGLLQLGVLPALKQQITQSYSDPSHWLRNLLPMKRQGTVALNGYLQAVDDTYERIAYWTWALLAPIVLLLCRAVLPSRIRTRLSWAFWLSLSTALVVGYGLARYHDSRPESWYLLTPDMIPLGVVLALGYISAAVFILWNSSSLYSTTYWLRGMRPKWIVAAFSLLIGLAALRSRLSVPVAQEFLLQNVTVYSIKAPGIFMASHPMYFGAIISVAVVYWVRAVEVIRNYGGGLVLAVSLALVLSLASESRLSTNFLPIVVTSSVLALDARGALTGRMAILFALLSVVMSRFWFPLSGSELRYFMSQGPWMSREAYFGFLASAIASMVLVRRLFRPALLRP